MGALLGLLRGIPLKVWAVWFVVFASAFVMTNQQRQIRELGTEVRVGKIALDSVGAALDTTKLLNERLNDSLLVYQKRVVQLADISSEIEEMYDQEVKARADLELRITDVTAQVPADSVISVNADSVRIADFSAYRPPLTIDAHVEITQEKGTAEFAVRFDPIPLRVELSCGPSVNGFRSANIFVATPYEGIVPNVASVVQDAETCNPAPYNVKLNDLQKLNQLPMYMKVGIPLLLLLAVTY